MHTLIKHSLANVVNVRLDSHVQSSDYVVTISLAQLSRTTFIRQFRTHSSLEVNMSQSLENINLGASQASASKPRIMHVRQRLPLSIMHLAFLRLWAAALGYGRFQSWGRHATLCYSRHGRAGVDRCKVSSERGETESTKTSLRHNIGIRNYTI